MTYLINGLEITQGEIYKQFGTKHSLHRPLNSNDLEVLGARLIYSSTPPICSVLEKVERDGVEEVDGLLYEKWAITPKFQDADGVTKAEQEAEYLQQIQAEAVSNAIAKYEKFVTDYIQAKIEEYNKENGLAFKDIDAFTKYALIPTSQHNTVALRFITYADNVWGAMREYQASLTAIPNDEEVVVILEAITW